MYNNTCKCTTHTHTHCVYAHLTYKPLHHQGLIDIQFTQVQHYIKSRMFIVVIITHLALHTHTHGHGQGGTHTHNIHRYLYYGPKIEDTCHTSLFCMIQLQMIILQS